MKPTPKRVTAKELVLDEYPLAECHQINIEDGWDISYLEDVVDTLTVLGSGKTPRQAWADAESRLRK